MRNSWRRDGRRAEPDGWCPDPYERYEQRLRRDGKLTGWVMHAFWDPQFGERPDGLYESRGEYPEVFAQHGDRGKISGPEGNFLDVKLGSCVSVKVDPSPCSGSQTIGLRLLVEIDDSSSPAGQNSRVCLYLPGEAEAGVKAFAEAVRNERERLKRANESLGECRDADLERRSCSASAPLAASRHRHSASHSTTARDELYDTVQSLAYSYEEIGSSKQAEPVPVRESTTRHGQRDSGVAVTPPDGVDQSALDSARTPALPRLTFAQVPDTEEWLSFRTLASGDEIRA